MHVLLYYRIWPLPHSTVVHPLLGVRCFTAQNSRVVPGLMTVPVDVLAKARVYVRVLHGQTGVIEPPE